MNKKLHIYATIVAFATFLLVIAGGLVTSTGSSLSVPDWPLSFGKYFPEMTGGVFYEHGHRMIAGTVAILTLVLVIWLFKTEPRRIVRFLGLAALMAVLMQAALGGITVLYRLPPTVSIAHACLGQTFFCLIVAIAVLTSNADPIQRGETFTKLQRLAILTLIFIFIQLLAGATLRHTGKALHIHLTFAALVLIHVILLMKRAIQTWTLESCMGKAAAGMGVLVLVQVFLGYISWRTGPVGITTAHVAIGALLYAGTTAILVRSFQQISSSSDSFSPGGRRQG